MSYWKVRQQEQLKALEKDEKELMNRLLNYYQAEYAKLDKEIASFYKRYGEKNIIEYRNLLLELPQQEKKLLIEQVEKFAKQYPHLKHIVPVRENIYKLNRLEGLQLSIVMQQFEIGAYNEENVRKHLEKLALRNVNSVADLLGFGKNFYFENKEIIKNFVGVKWCEGKDFSMRIWQNTEKLANYLTTDIAQGFARGESYEKLTTLLGKRFINVTKKDVYRVIYTEGTYVMAESSAKTLEQEFEQYKLSTVSDGKECSKCREIAGKTFNFAEREPGVNFPPIHPMCRCTFEIIVDDWNKWLDEYEKKHSKSGKKITNRFNKEERLKTTNNNDILQSIGSYGRAVDDISLKNVSKVKIPGLSEEQNKKVYLQRKNLLKQLVNQPAGVEGSVIVPLDSDDVFNVLIGGIGQTKIDNYDGLYYAIHNHPNSDVLSPGDLIGVLQRSKMFGIEALGNDGKTVFAITKSFNSDVTGYLKYIYIELDEFKLKNPNLDTYKDYGLLKDFSTKLLEKGTEYGFKIIRR